MEYSYDGKEINSDGIDGFGSSADSDIWTSDDYESDDDDDDDDESTKDTKDVKASLLEQYDKVWDLYNGLFLTKKDGLYGFADKNGNTLIEPRYLDVDEKFEDGMIWGF